MLFSISRYFHRQLKRIFSDISLRTVLVVPFLLQVVLTVSLVGYFSFRNGEEAVQDLASQLRNELTERINQRLQTYVKSSHSVNRLNVDAFSKGELDFSTGGGANQFLQQLKIASYVNAVYCGNQETGDFLGVSRTDDGNYFELMIRNFETNEQMYLYGIDVRADRLYFLRDAGPYDPRKRPWYQVARAFGQPTWSDIYLDFTTKLPTITASLAAYDDWGNDFIGVCGTDVLLTEELRKFLKKLHIGKTGEAFIMERSGLLVSSSTDDPITVGTGDDAKMLQATESRDPLVQATAEYLIKNFSSLQTIQKSQQLDFKIDGKRQFVQVLPFNDGRGLDWLIVLVIPESDFMDKINASKRTTILLCMAVLIIPTTFSITMARWISTPILRLSSASQAIASGDLNQYVKYDNIRELRTLSQSFNTMSRQLREYFETLENRVEERTFELHQEKEKSEKLLLNILPKAIADQLKEEQKIIASAIQNVTILFADIVGFTPLSARVSPIELVGLLNQMFSRFDELAERHKLEKIKTIGDAYMVVGGLPIPREDHAEAIADMAIEMQEIMSEFNTCKIFGNIPGCDNFQIRIGINTGPVVAGVIGIKKFSYDLWGNAVNIASRMESSGEPGCIQVTDITYERLKYRYKLQPRGTIKVKGKGYMTTYWLLGKLA
jgi:adenylate cyclase